MAYDPADFNSTADSSALGDGIVIPAYDKVLKWALHPKVVWRQFIDVHPVDPTNNSDTINLKRHNLLTVTSGDLAGIDEVAAPDVTAAPQTTNVEVVLGEYGKTMGRTTWLGDVAYVPVDPALLRQITTHMSDLLDFKARAAFLLGTNRFTADGGAIGAGTGTGIDSSPANVNTLTAADTISAAAIRRCVKELRKRNVEPWRGENYVSVISHETSLDIQEGVGSVPWQAPKVNVDTSNLYTGYVGTFAGADFVETNRAFADTDGSSSAAVHRTVFFGREVVVEAVKREPHVGRSPMTDPMNRHYGIYWYGSAGWALYRNEAVQRLEHGVSSNSV